MPVELSSRARPCSFAVLAAAFVACVALASAQETPPAGPLRLLPPIEGPSIGEPVSSPTESQEIDFLPAAEDEAVSTPVVDEAPPEPAPDDTPVAAVVDEAIVDDALAAEQEEPPVYVWYQPAYWFGPTPWDTAVELGVNGSSGTSESFSIRTGGNVKRESDRHKLAMSLYYNNTAADGVTTQSNALFDGRRDWLFTDSAWSLFGLSQVYYDEFQAFDLNVNVNGGLGYDWVKSEAVEFATSFGAGASREFGGPGDEWTPEAQLGLNYQQTIYNAHKFYAKVDYFPEWEDFNRYRILSDIGLEFELSRPSNVSLKIAATDRFDSDPDGVRPHNTNYSVLLLWKL